MSLFFRNAGEHIVSNGSITETREEIFYDKNGKSWFKLSPKVLFDDDLDSVKSAQEVLNNKI